MWEATQILLWGKLWYLCRYHNRVHTRNLCLTKPLAEVGFAASSIQNHYSSVAKPDWSLFYKCYTCLTVKNALVNIFFTCKQCPLGILTGKGDTLVVVLPWFSESQCRKDLVWSRCELWLDHRKARCKGLRHQTGGCPCCSFHLSSWSPHLKESQIERCPAANAQTCNSAQQLTGKCSKAQT